MFTGIAYDRMHQMSLSQSNYNHLSQSINCFREKWTQQLKDELLLRHGALQFEWLRDYRKKSHAGLSDATSLRYDFAIHMNRHAPFGICEIQIMTEDLYKRACLDSPQDEGHQQFTHRRNQIFK
jgi:hypothetical protein